MAKDVTEEILHNHLIYGCSDNTNQGRTAAGKSLNYANGASIQKAPEYELNAIPFTHKFEDTWAFLVQKTITLTFMLTS